MNNTSRYLPLLILVLMSFILAGCPKSLDEKIQEGTRITPLSEAVHARDRAIKSAVESNIMIEPDLQWFAKNAENPLVVEVSHTVVTVFMVVKTQEQHDRVIAQIRKQNDVSDIIDNITIDPTIEDAPFEW